MRSKNVLSNKSLRSVILAFWRADHGAVAMIFALALVPIVVMIGAAIDYSRASAVRTRLQTALDSAVLAAALKQGTDNDRFNAFNSAFRSYYVGAEASEIEATLDLSTAGLVRGTAGGGVKVMFGGLMGISTVNVSVNSEGRIPGAVEVMMVLDVSGSMKATDMSGQARIDVLKDAATSLVDTAVAEAPAGAKLKFGYVPFTMNVNIGASNTAFVDGADDPLFTGASWAGCVLERAPPNHNSINFSPTNKYRAYIYPPETDNASCDNSGDGTNKGYKVIDLVDPTYGPLSGYTRGPNYNCVRHPVAPLTTDTVAIKTKIASLTSQYNLGTILAPGVTWGMRLLTPNAPFPGADPLGSGTRKVMVMLTDGSQTTEMRYSDCNGTQNSGAPPYQFVPATLGLSGRPVGPNGPRDFFGPYGYIYDSDPFGEGFTDYAQVDASLDPIAVEACAAVKAQGVEVYAIAVSSSAGPGTRVNDTLRACASDPSHFYYATDATTLTNAFVEIGRKAARFVRTK